MKCSSEKYLVIIITIRCKNNVIFVHWSKTKGLILQCYCYIFKNLELEEALLWNDINYLHSTHLLKVWIAINHKAYNTVIIWALLSVSGYSCQWMRMQSSNEDKYSVKISSKLLIFYFKWSSNTHICTL